MKIVVKIGGSVSIGEKGPDFSYFSRLLPVLEGIKRKNQLIIVIGGGKLTRAYGKSIEKFGLARNEKEEIFIKLIEANVRFLSAMLKMKPIFSLDEIRPNTSGVIGGIVPGRSTDANGAIAAKRIGADVFIKMTNVDGIYTKDPKKSSSARKLDKITFAGMKKLAVKGSPNKYGVLDRTAVQALSSAKIKTIVLDGKEPKNILKTLKSSAISTLIHT